MAATGGIPSIMEETKRFRRAGRLDRLPPYLFVEIDRAKRALVERGVDLVDLGIGDPDLPTPPEVVEALRRACENPAAHRYPSQRGDPSLRAAIAAWLERRHGVAVDPDREVLVLIGTKEGLGHLPLAAVDAGSTALVPDPAYPVYQAAVWLAGGEVVPLPLREERGFLPRIEGLDDATLETASLLVLNYPNNPTGAVADGALFREAVDLASRRGLLVVNDAAYAELCFDGPAVSLLETPGAREVGVEFHSFSKTFNMTGWRVGFVVGSPDALDALAAVKSNVDSGVFTAVQRAAEAALALPDERIRQQVDVYRRRRDTLVDGLAEAGWHLPRPRAAFYVWSRIPTDEGSAEFAARVLRDAHVVVTPGVGFGVEGEGYVRMALTAPEERVAEAVRRIRSIL